MSYDREKYAAAYAKALIDVVSIKEGDDFIKQLTQISQIFAENQELVSAFESRGLPEQAEKDLISELCKNARPSLQNFLEILIKNGHIRILERICDKFVTLQNKRKGLMNFKVKVTYLPDSEQQRKLEETLKNKFNLKEVNIDYLIDRDLVGGIIIESESYLIDDSIRSRLDQIRDSLIHMKINTKELEA
jgi:F-type H+-transporting ATPase subunit delta